LAGKVGHEAKIVAKGAEHAASTVGKGAVKVVKGAEQFMKHFLGFISKFAKNYATMDEFDKRFGLFKKVS
jgi:hypothetical protein